ncbi:MAG: phasin family protein [Sphingopyxis sp.]|nr:phasin family protein [Sphingopyxis sp.]
MATKIDSAEKAFEAASAEAAAVKTVVAEKAAEVTADVAKAAAPVVKAVKEVAAKAAPAKAPVKAKTVAPKAKPVAAKKPAVVKAAAKKVTPVKAKIAKAAPAKKTTTATKSTATSPVAAAQKGLKTMNDTVKKFADEAKTRFESLSADMNGRSKEAMEKASKLAEEAVEFQKANIEAIVESGKIAAKGMQVLGEEGVAFGRKSIEEVTASLKSYTAVKTPVEFFQLYAENSKKAFDTAVAQTSKTSEMVVKLANDSFAPISNRVSEITAKVKAAA